LKAKMRKKEVALARKISSGTAVLVTLLVLAQLAPAGVRSGSLRGKIVDQQGFPLTGAYVYVTSPSLLGVHNFITSESGRYALLDLPPGTYKIMVEMPGFKTVTVEGILLPAGTTVTTDFKMEPTEIEEEKVSLPPPSGPNKGSARLAVVLDRDLLTRIPLSRDFSSVLGLVPGLVFENDVPSTYASVHGAPPTSNAFEEDGVDVTDPVSRTSLSRINVDLLDQVVVETSAVPPDRGAGEGAYINVIRKSGGNIPDGSLSLALTTADISKSLWSQDELSTLGATAPMAERSDVDLSWTQGGPVIQDIAWFFGNLRFRSKSLTGPFVTWKDPLNATHYPYNLRDTSLSGTFKLMTQVIAKIKGTLELDFSSDRQPHYESDVARNRPAETTRRLSSQPLFAARAGLVYGLDPKTIVDLSVGYVNRRQSVLLNAATVDSPEYYDLRTGFFWGSGPYNDQEARKRLDARMTITRLVDKALGASHELAAGLDYESTTAQSSVWKADNLIMNYLNGSPYAFGQTVSPVSGNTVGTGHIGFSIVPATAGSLVTTRELKRLGFFAQNTLNFGGRLVFSLGLRFDRSDTSFLSISKGSVGNAVALAVGTDVIEPVYGFNPFTAGVVAAWDNVVTWNSLSPRFGLSFDLFGTGKTLLRGSFSRLPEELGLGYSVDLDPLPADRVHNFTWYDENGDGLVDEDDSYVMFPENYNVYNYSSIKSRIDPGLKAPMTEEWTAGVDHELAPDITLSARYVSRSQKGIIADVMYDPASQRSWYTIQGSPEGWWVPFTTIVPAAGAYPDTSVTVYLRSTSAPAVADRIQQVPELSRAYRGLEFSLRKRMSHNWQLFASIVWSRSTGTAGAASLLSAGISGPVLTPNSFVNVASNSRTGFDRPLVYRLMGTVRFKYDIYLSAYFRTGSGSPWGRTVTITPPAGWAADHGADATPVTVFLESPGIRRHSSWQTTDLRLEKEILRRGRARWTIYLDILNVLGNKYKIVDYNDGFWYPDGEGASSGTHLLSSTYGQAVYLSGTRTGIFSVRLGF
jgi:hypothetical protein